MEESDPSLPGYKKDLRVVVIMFCVSIVYDFYGYFSSLFLWISDYLFLFAVLKLDFNQLVKRKMRCLRSRRNMKGGLHLFKER